MEETIARFTERYHYCPETGNLYYKVSTGRVKKGDRVGTTCLGYRVTKINNKHYFIHKIVWALHHGYIPDNVDHINGDKLDNRIENLRECSHQDNMRNRKKKLGKTLSKGVYKHHNKYKAMIRSDGVEHYLGLFNSEREAAQAYNTAAERLHGDFAKLNDLTSL